MTINTRPADRYDAARWRMAQTGTPIPFATLRAYLDWLLNARRNAVGDMYVKRLVITGQWLRPGAYARVLFEQAISEGYVIDTEGQKWTSI